MGATKTTTQVKDWAAITAASQDDTSEIDLSGLHRVGLIVTVCPIEAVANAEGVRITIEARIGDNDEDWRDLYELRMAAGTANTTNIDVEAAATDTVVPVDLTANFETTGDKFLIHNTVAVAASETCRIVTFASNDTITILDGLKNIQQTSANLYDIVAEKYFPIPDEYDTIRVVALNDDADCDVIWRVDRAQITAIT